MITPPPRHTVFSLLEQLGYTKDDDGIRAALLELLDRRAATTKAK